MRLCVLSSLVIFNCIKLIVQFFFFVFSLGIWRKFCFRSFNFVILTSWMVLKWGFECLMFLKLIGSCSCALHIIKNAFKLFFLQKFLDFSSLKIFHCSISQTIPLTDQKSQIFRPKLSAWFDWCLIDFWPIETRKF